MADWYDLYARELYESPPAEDFLAAYFKYKPKQQSAQIDDDFIAALGAAGRMLN